MNTLAQRAGRSHGFTLIELMVTITVSAILLSLAVPGFTEFMDRYRLEGAVQGLYSDLQFARSESVKSNRSVQIAFTTGNSWSYTLSSLDGICATSALTPTALKTSDFNGFAGTQIANVSLGCGSTTLVFQPVSSTVQNACANGSPLPAGSKVVFQSSQGKQACVHINLIGRTKLCSPAGSTYLLGFPECAC
ncbi:MULTISPECIES: GspH/FimT family pseudopilin [unclassified Thiocapsa]|uniref:GspH/FimT family pseudopilin n=1 Tax=unclassified Thiocapsa TaxID=2641286 RepID=UPI0035ADCFA5